MVSKSHNVADIYAIHLSLRVKIKCVLSITQVINFPHVKAVFQVIGAAQFPCIIKYKLAFLNILQGKKPRDIFPIIAWSNIQLDRSLLACQIRTKQTKILAPFWVLVATAPFALVWIAQTVECVAEAFFLLTLLS